MSLSDPSLCTNSLSLRYYDDDRPLGGESYRPSDHNARNYRSPPRRTRTPPSRADSYTPATDRRRSRSPGYRGRGGPSYAARPRSPPRAYSPRRDTRARSPLPRVRRYSRSPVGRARSPPPARRDPSPYRRPRSPLPARRDYSPPRYSRPRFPNENNYRPGERSPTPPRRSEHVSRVPSPISSRRSSPPIHPDRLANTGSGTHSPAIRGGRAPPAGPRDHVYRDRSPPRRGYSPVPVPQARDQTSYRARSPPPHERDDSRTGPTPAAWSDTQIAGPKASGYRNGDTRPPPSGPAVRDSYSRDSPSVPPPAAPISMSAHNRPTSASLLSAPTRPRGGPSFGGRGDSRDHQYGPRGGRGAAPSSYHGPPSRGHYDSRPPPGDHIPQGPRGSHHGPPSSFEAPYRAPPPFRSNNSSSTTYPRTQRFSNNHLASVPSIKEGGEALPSATDPAARKRLAELEEGRKKLLDQIEEKQREKRKGLREWGSRERESRRDSLKSELAEEALDRMNGDGPGTGGAAF